MQLRVFASCFLMAIALFLLAPETSGQRWKKKKKETLFARNKKKNTSPVYVGIGIKDATAQLHTVGTVRHEGLAVNNSLTSILAIDGSGNVFWRDISNTLGNAWFLNGNTIAASNFFGTTNNEDLRIRTNNNQQAILTRTGLFGIGVATPSAQLHSSGSVRFEGVTNDNTMGRLVSMDNNGNLYWRDVASLSSNSWMLNGNAATASSFLGTTNSENIRFRVNNIERAVLSSTGLGIGIATPAAQFHTNGSVRLEGVTSNNTTQRLASLDNNGNMFFRDVTSLPFWSLTGNAGTNPATNFLGSTDNTRIVFRTNNAERMTILPDGKVGIGEAAPVRSLIINSSTPDNHLGLFGSAPSVAFQGPLGPDNAGRIGYATVTNNYVNGSVPGDFIVQNMSATASLIFGTTGGGTGNGVERARITASGFFGIATAAPTATLHTNGSLRFQGLLAGSGNPLVVDANGNVSIGSSSPVNNWSLTGNAATNPAVNFLGTTDNTRLVIRTNNSEKMTILPDGKVGIGEVAPVRSLIINSSAPDNHLGLFGSAPSVAFQGPLGPDNAGRIGYATVNNNYVNGSVPGDFIVQSLSATASLIFGTTGGGLGNGIERARINASGFFGIATAAPTATLHTNGTVRFQNLPTGTGNALVMDANGNVFKSLTLTGRPEEAAVKELSTQVEELRKEVEELRAVIQSMRTGAPSVHAFSSEVILYQNSPNPFNKTTVISYYLPEDMPGAVLQINDLKGKVLQRFKLGRPGYQNVRIDAGMLPAGTYVYALFVNGEKMVSKKMILTR